MKHLLRNMTLSLAGAVLLAPYAEGAVAAGHKKDGLTKFENEIRHELVMLPWYGVFDNLEFQVNGDEVILMGQVTRPVLRSDAENVVRRIEGVERVVNRIAVLPLSRFDDDIRRGAYYQIFGFGPLGRYAWGPLPPVRIIVENGNITLKGVVADESDKNMAGLRANAVRGAFSVSNELKVENGRD